MDTPSDVPTIDTFPYSRSATPPLSAEDKPYDKVMGEDFAKATERMKQDFESLSGNMMGWMEQGRDLLRGMETLGVKL